MKKIALNPDFIVIATQEDTLFLLDKRTEKQIQLSPIEYEILQFYVQSKNIAETFHYFAKNYEIDLDFLNNLIDRAKQFNLLIHQNIFKTHFFKGIYGLFYALNKQFNTKLIPDFYGNYRLFKLFHIQLSDTILNRFLAKPIVSIVFLTIFLSIFGFFAVFAIQHYSEISFYFNDRSHLFRLYFSFFALLSLTLCLHEWAHYLTYRIFGGTFAKMGFGISFGFFPVMYMTLSTDFQKYKTLKNIAIALAGPLLDFTLALLGLYLVFIFKDNYFLWNFFSLFSFGLFFRGLNNFNFLLPGTDAYHILSDSLHTQQLFKTSLGEWKLVLTHQKSELSLSKKLFYLFYGLISISMILIITTLFFFFTIFLPFV